MTSSRVSAVRAPRKVVPATDAEVQILDAADDLFYREGARAVGIDAVVKRAGVNKMSLYRRFESKDALLLLYLERREARFWEYFDASAAKCPGDARAQLLQWFADLAERTGKADYRGCPFVNIAVEFPDPAHAARGRVAANKRELLRRLYAMATAAGAADPESLASGLALLTEGAYAASQTFGPGNPLHATLPRVAQMLIDAACGAANSGGKPDVRRD